MSVMDYFRALVMYENSPEISLFLVSWESTGICVEISR